MKSSIRRIVVQRTVVRRAAMQRAATHGRGFSSAGFTLLELVIAMGLFVALLSILWNVVSLFSRAQIQSGRLAERSQLVRSLTQLLEDDLRAAIQDPIHPHQNQAGDDDIRRFGLSGSSQTLRIDVIEINPFAPTEEQQPRSALFGEIQSAQAKAAELKTVFYDFRAESGLSRREIDFETPDINAPGPEGSNMSAPEIVDCRFRYFNGSSWSDSWESLERSGLPVAIEAKLQSLPLSEAVKLRRSQSTEEDLLKRIRFLGLSQPNESRIVAYLPTSPVRKFGEYKRKTPPKKEDPFAVPPPPATLTETPPPEPPPEAVAPAGPSESWIRNK